MQTIDDLSAKWNSLKQYQGESVYQGYDASHPLRFFVGLDSSGNREFFLIINRPPSYLPAHSRSIEVISGIRKDGSHTLVFKLAKPDQQEVFTHLCWDLAESSRSYKDIDKGLAKVLSRYALWQRLMEKGGIGSLSEQEIKGLFGEILFLKNWLFAKYGVIKAVDGWIGSYKTDRDFIYDDIWYEVKTTNPGISSLKISSIEQLDTENVGRLIWLQAEKTTSTDIMGISFTALINETKNVLQEFPRALGYFETCLLEAGYVDCKEYNDFYFVCRGMKLYIVDKNFPRIRRRDINSGIITATYEISVSSISIFETVWG